MTFPLKFGRATNNFVASEMSEKYLVEIYKHTSLYLYLKKKKEEKIL